MILNSIKRYVIKIQTEEKNKNTKDVMSYNITELEFANMFKALTEERLITVIGDRVISSSIVTLEGNIVTNVGTDSSIANPTTRKLCQYSALSIAEVRAIASDFISLCSLWSMIFVVWLLFSTPCVLIIYYFLHL
ncbi:hypothetical protein WA1_26965 [Scytonema hofmannii PCC 7110]|uniref:Uncharacterized protein n=1 Tax=Scytonema hofmannii PCC 7110 TaxID=128403 RepID=A0A139X675_9CYAN|nr:hypothetical protein [Scytonema hofmannii]KYC40184.1 hypothetical protein WA1_26965 [Scytonema hofmannii PCC 7110]